MKRFSKLIILGLAVMTVAASLSGCAHRKKTAYQTYMQNVLDVNYKGDFDGFTGDNDGSKEDAAAMYSDATTYLAHQLMNHYSLSNAASEDVEVIFEEVARTIYSKSKYEVSQAYKSGDEYMVDVTVYPMNILNQSFDEIFSYIDEYNKKVSDGAYEDTSKEDYEKEFAQGIADILKSNADGMEYLNPVVVSVAIVDDGEYYTADSSGLSEVDASMLAIEGSRSGAADGSEAATEGASK